MPKCVYIGCKNKAKYETVTKTPYITQKPNYYCNEHAHDWMIKGDSVQGVIMGINFTTTAKRI